MTPFDPRSPFVLLSCAEMAQADRATIAAGTPGEELMEAAGRAVAEEALAHHSAAHALVLAGPGNNGGDGFVAARRLREAGVEVRLALLGEREGLTGDAATMAARYEGPVVAFEPSALGGADLVVDALFGAGLSRPVTGAAAEMVAAANAADAFRVAVDIPTGISGDEGVVMGTAFAADLTITFFRKKPGHTLVPGRFYCALTLVRDIGIDARLLDDIAPRTFENAPDLWRADWPSPDPAGHKYDRGHALVLSGRPPALGATRMTAMAALRAGAGLVTLAVEPEAWAIQATALTEVMCAPFADESAFDSLLADPRRNAAALGPGAGVDKTTRRCVLAVLDAGKRAVLDADALTAFAAEPARLFEAISGDVVLTPHGGEFARLFGEAGESGKLATTRAAAARSRAVVVHKGADTVIAAPDGSALIETGAPPHLATAGSGDVLTGIVAGLLAQGMPTLAAAAAAVSLHAAAARRHGRGMIAGDLIASLPDAIAEIEAPSPPHPFLSPGGRGLLPARSIYPLPSGKREG